MKLRKLYAVRFGCLRDWESRDLQNGIVVVYGKNETGKTTLFNLISTILYGWNPVSENPFVPWDESFADCGALMEDDKGLELKITRKLRNKPEGLMFINDKKEELGNRVIPQLSTIPVSIFKEVYMLTVDELKFPGLDTWEKIQDRLLGGQYATMFNPMMDVLSKLEEEAISLWRPDRKGNPEDKKLLTLQKELRSRLKKAEENETSLYSAEQRLETLRSRIDELNREKLSIVKSLERSERLYPVYKKLRKIDELTQDIQGIIELNKIPDNPYDAFNELVESKEGLILKYEKLAERKDGLEKRRNCYTDFHRNLIMHRDSINSIIKSYGQAESDLNTLNDLDMEWKRERDKLTYRAKDILQGGWEDSLSDILAGIDEADLGASIQAYRAIDIKYREQEARVYGLKTGIKPSKYSLPLIIISVLLFLSGCFGVLASADMSFKILSGIISLISLGLFFTSIFMGKGRRVPGYREAAVQLGEVSGRRQKAVENVKAALKGLPIAALRLEDPGESLLVDVNILKEIMYKLNDIYYKKENIKKRLEEKSRITAAVIEACNILRNTGLLNNISLLEKSLKESEECYLEYKDALRRLDEVNGEISIIQEDIKGLDDKIQSIISALNKVPGQDMRQKSDNLMERRKRMKSAEALREEMEHDYPDLEDLKRQVEVLLKSNEIWIFDDEKILELKVRREELENKLIEMNQEVGSLKKEMEKGQGLERPCDIKGQIQSIDIERHKAAVKRDKLMLLKNILLEADKRFREENQPDVLRIASSYISAITGGKYTRMYADENMKGLAVKGNTSEDTLDVERRMLSRGTREQIYLSLRLAVLDHLDSGGEKLPLFLDEAFVNYDETRLTNCLALLKQVAKNRQVFIFTCSQSFKDMLTGEGIQHMELI